MPSPSPRLTYFPVGVVVVEDTEGDGGEDAGEVEEEGCRDDLLHRLVSHDAVPVVGEVVRQPSFQVLPEPAGERAALLLWEEEGDGLGGAAPGGGYGFCGRHGARCPRQPRGWDAANQGLLARLCMRLNGSGRRARRPERSRFPAPQLEDITTPRNRGQGRGGTVVLRGRLRHGAGRSEGVGRAARHYSQSGGSPRLFPQFLKSPHSPNRAARPQQISV